MKKLLVILATLLALSACKKNNATEPDTNKSSAQTTGVNTTPTSSVIANGLPGNLINVSAVLKADYEFRQQNNAGDFSADATLYTTDKPFFVSFSYNQVGDLSDNVGSLKINTTTLKKDSTSNPLHLMYTDTTNANYISGVTWQLNSSGTFPSFTTTVTRGFPVVTNTIVLLDTVTKTTGFTINLLADGVTNADSVTIFIPNTFNNSILRKTVAGSATSIIIDATNLANFTPSAQFFNLTYGITLYITNYSHNTINNKTLVYVMQKTIVSQFYLKP